MKHTLLYCGATIAFYVLSSLNGFAKPLSTAGNFSKHAAFTENKGQVTDQYHKPRPDIDFKLQSNGMTMFVGDGQIHYQWYQSNKKEKSKNEKITDGTRGELNSEPAIWNTYRMDVVLIGANKNAELVTEDRQLDYENYYVPNREDAITAYSYKKITYKNIYPNIDWEIASPNPSQGGEAVTQGCKYNFIVHPGGDYRNIKVKYNGATFIALKDSALTASTPMGSIIENVPYTYDAETKKEIKSNFILNNNILTYNIALPSGSREGIEGRDGVAFIIDPVLKWGTYYGGAKEDRMQWMTTDSAGYSYIAGYTSSNNNIATSGSYQQTYADSNDAMLAKFNTSGQLIWASYYGGIHTDIFKGIALNAGGTMVYVCGSLGTTGLATSGAYQSSANPFGWLTGFIACFDASGTRQWATYYGQLSSSNFSSSPTSIVCNNNNELFILGNCGNDNSVISSGAFQSVYGGVEDVFIAKFSSGGVRQWGTYYGGNDGEGAGWGGGICTDFNGNVYITGKTRSPNNIASTGAQQTSNAGNNDIFIAKFNNAGQRIWGTYYGGTADDYGKGIKYDMRGSLYLTASTFSTTGIATTGAFQTTPALSALIKMDTSGTLVWATYHRSANIANIDVRGNICLLGIEAAAGYATPGAYKTLPSGSADMLLSVFSAAGNRLYATYYGGTDLEGGFSYWEDQSVACSNNKIFMAAHTNSTNGISTPGTAQTSFGGGGGGNVPGDAFLVQFDMDTMVNFIQPFMDTLFCVGDSIHIKYAVTWPFRSGNTFTLQLSNASGSFASPTTLATVTGSVGGTFNTIMPVVTAGTGYRLRIIASAPADTSSDNGINIKVRPNPTTPVATANTPVCAGQTLNLSSSNSSMGVVWSWAGPNSFTAATQNASIPNVQTNATGDYYVTANLNGCKRKDTVSVTVNPSPAKPNATGNSPICSGQTLNLFATTTTGGVSWSWAGPGGFNTSAQNPTIPNAQTANAGSYVVTATLGNCSSSDTEVVVINQGPAINIYPSPNDTICQGGSVTLVAVPVSAGTGPAFQWYKNSNPIGGATSTSYSTTPNNGDVYYCRMTPGTGTSCTGAVSSNSITMTVLPVTTPSVSISGPSGAQDPYNLLTFHATGTGGGSNPTYQWLRSGHQLIQGATGDTWSTQGLYLSQHDTICVILTSSDICAVPKSDTACMAVNILTGVEDINKHTTIQLYPNPNDGRFTIEAKGIANKEVTIEITNAVGQTMHQQKANTAKGILHETISTNNLSAGIYLLKLHDGDAVATLRLVISR